MPMELRAIWSPNSYDGRRFVCGDQSGRTSAPINPHRVQTIREHSDRTGVSSGSQRRSQAYVQTGMKVGCGSDGRPLANKASARIAATRRILNSDP
jgi:hypothetical protein